MCGISGIISFDGTKVERPALKSMADRIAHRGPDAEGFWLNAGAQAGFGHRRLSILDLSEAGRQPMHSPDGRYTIVFNGEIYNFVELRAGLEARGRAFKTGTDTEVLLALYREKKEACLDELDGMFAFAIWDEAEKTLFCARDRMGEKPFFYHHAPGRRFLFASEMKALFAAGVDRRLREERLFAYLAYAAVEDPWDPSSTFYESVRQLEPAHCLWLRADGSLTLKRYWQAGPESPAPPSLEEACARFSELFEISIRRRLRSDVPVGSCLSGGLDSSSIVLKLDELRKQGDLRNFSQKTFSARMPDPKLDEGAFMQAVIDRSSVEPHYAWLEADAVIDQLDDVCRHQEEPFNSTSPVAQWLVMKLAAQHGVPVLIDGQGADEVLGGYEGYYAIYFRELYRSDRARLREELAAYEKIKGRPFRLGMRFRLEALFPGLLATLGSLRRRIGPQGRLAGIHPDLVHRHRGRKPPYTPKPGLNAALRASSFQSGLTHLLRLCDRNSMAFSREVRLPFLSRELVEFVFSLPASYKLREGWTKYLLRKSMAPLLPEQIAWRRDKLGFVAPFEQWLAHPRLRERFEDSARVLQKNGIIAQAEPGQGWAYLQLASMLRTR